MVAAKPDHDQRKAARVANAASFTVTGTGFGTGSGTAWLGDRAASVVSWSDTQVVATVDPSAKSGVAKILQNGVWSNAIPFSLPPSGGAGNTVVPSVINMAIGDRRPIQALDSSNRPVTGLTWTSRPGAGVRRTRRQRGKHHYFDLDRHRPHLYARQSRCQGPSGRVSKMESRS